MLGLKAWICISDYIRPHIAASGCGVFFFPPYIYIYLSISLYLYYTICLRCQANIKNEKMLNQEGNGSKSTIKTHFELMETRTGSYNITDTEVFVPTLLQRGKCRPNFSTLMCSCKPARSMDIPPIRPCQLQWKTERERTWRGIVGIWGR